MLATPSQSYRILAAMAKPSIKETAEYQNKELLALVWKLPVALLYLKGTLEYQPREGFCAPSTVRNILKSIPHFDQARLPDLVHGPSLPAKVAKQIDGFGVTTSRVVYGKLGYDAFMAAIRKANDPNYRLAVNFLRGPLFGPNEAWLAPMSHLMGFAAGHFSPIVGYLEDLDLVAIFDLNHNYGLFLVDSQRLFTAVNTLDFLSGTSRGIVVCRVQGHDGAMQQ
ncbi:hypothetical protein HDV03_004556 [Kappamyces sp. JEL0829]|nr:hypothetical protein HDV03_004556 [Kappamyces sp. JEL0829]